MKTLDKVKSTRSQKIRDLFIQRLSELLSGLKVESVKDITIADASQGLGVHVLLPTGKKHTLCLLLRSLLVPSRVRDGIHQLKTHIGRSKDYPMLAAPFISERVAAICEQEQIGYVDLAGNVSIRLQAFHSQKVVEKNPSPQRGRPASLFSPVSSRISRALLESPQQRWRITDLTQATGASLGQVSNVTQQLIGEGFVQKTPRGLELIRAAELLEAWRRKYKRARHQHSPYYMMGSDPEAFMKRVALVAADRKLRYAFTGFAAAELLAPFVRGIGRVEWYIEQELDRAVWVEALGLRPVHQGPNVILIVPNDPGVFYQAQEKEGKQVVAPVQLYLDLWNDPARGKEQAEHLRRECLLF